MESNFLKFFKLLLIGIKSGSLSYFWIHLKLHGPSFYRRFVWNRYCKGFCNDAQLVNPEIKAEYDEFKKNGFVVIEKAGECIVSLLENRVTGEPDEFGRVKTPLTACESDHVFNMLGPRIHQILRRIYGRHYWIRETAFIMQHNSNMSKDHIQSDWHVDGYNQVTLQILLQDSGQDPVSTEFAIGSHRYKWSNDRSKICFDDLKAPKYSFSGRKGDLIIFNGGQCLHRSKMGVDGRNALFINLSTGWYEGKTREIGSC